MTSTKWRLLMTQLALICSCSKKWVLNVVLQINLNLSFLCQFQCCSPDRSNITRRELVLLAQLPEQEWTASTKINPCKRDLSSLWSGHRETYEAYLTTLSRSRSICPVTFSWAFPSGLPVQNKHIILCLLQSSPSRLHLRSAKRFTCEDMNSSNRHSELKAMVCLIGSPLHVETKKGKKSVSAFTVVSGSMGWCRQDRCDQEAWDRDGNIL